MVMFLGFLTAIIKMLLTFFIAGQVFNYDYLTEKKAHHSKMKKSYNISIVWNRENYYM